MEKSFTCQTIGSILSVVQFGAGLGTFDLNLNPQNRFSLAVCQTSNWTPRFRFSRFSLGSDPVALGKKDLLQVWAWAYPKNKRLLHMIHKTAGSTMNYLLSFSWSFTICVAIQFEVWINLQPQLLPSFQLAIPVFSSQPLNCTKLLSIYLTAVRIISTAR